MRSVLYYDSFDWVSFDNASMGIGLNETIGKECCSRASRCLWGLGGVTTSLKTAVAGGDYDNYEKRKRIE